MTHLALSTTEPVVTITVPVRFLPELVAFLAAALNTRAKKPSVVETNAEEANGPGVANVLPLARTLRKVG